MSKKRKNPNHVIVVEYSGIDPTDKKKSLSIHIEKLNNQKKIFHMYQKLLSDGIKHSKQLVKSLEKTPTKMKLLTGETIRLMIEDSLIPIINPTGEHVRVGSDDKDVYRKLGATGEFFKWCCVLDLWNSPDVSIKKYSKTEWEKYKQKITNSLKLYKHGN